MDANFAAAYPDRAVAACNRAQAAALLAWDHHTAVVAGRAGVLLTLPWMERPLEETPEPLTLTLVFHYAERHPQAPPEVQALIDMLEWHVTAQGGPAASPGA